MASQAQDTKALQQALAAWRQEPGDQAAQAVIAAGGAVAKHYVAADWGLARFDANTLTPVVRWLERADDELILPCLRHLETLLPDPRATEPLLTLFKRELQRPIDRAMVARCLQKNADPREGRLAERLQVVEPWRTVRAADAEWEELVAHRDGRLAEMFSRPDDLSLRRITADWLMEHGDPYGELIVLQLQRGVAGQPTAQETELLKAHSRAWLHDFFHQEGIRDVRFELGLPVHARAGKELAWVPACAPLRSLELVADRPTWTWLVAERWKHIESVKPMPAIPARQLGESEALFRRFRPLMVYENTPPHAAELLVCRDGGVELFVHRGPPPYGWIDVVQTWIRWVRVEIFKSHGDTTEVPRWLRGAIVVHRLQPHEVAARSLQRRKAEE